MLEPPARQRRWGERTAKEILEQLLTYNDEANRRFIEAALNPSAERVRSILSHVLNPHLTWNARVGDVNPTGDPRKVRPADAWAGMNAENYRRSLELLRSDDTERVVEYRDTKGNAHESRVRLHLLHEGAWAVGRTPRDRWPTAG